jgi:hypothetical protein
MLRQWSNRFHRRHRVPNLIPENGPQSDISRQINSTACRWYDSVAVGCAAFVVSEYDDSSDRFTNALLAAKCACA